MMFFVLILSVCSLSLTLCFILVTVISSCCDSHDFNDFSEKDGNKKYESYN